MKNLKSFFAFFLLLALISSISIQGITKEPTMSNIQEEPTPKYLYKVLSIENWNESQNRAFLKLSPDDDAFIHLSKEDQLERITQKYWANVPKYVVLKIATAKLQGNLVYEANPGGSSRYYHLYNGSIPKTSVVDVKIVDSQK